jgi:UDP-N-acetylglucosamine 4,6-dehydratase
MLAARGEMNGIVLVTGGTGSFGSAMVAHLLESGHDEIRVFSRDEVKQEEMRLRFKNPRLRFYIGDVRDPDSLAGAMRGTDYVFHAAALKQVPSCEFFPLQAVMTNVLGSTHVIQRALAEGVKAVIALSTDKAVLPINAMGMTKALMEKTAQALSRTLSQSDTRLCCVRYGNVMYSRGSVIPRFVRQILDGVPLTVTEPSMTRFMLPLSHALSLVDFALEHGRQGDVFIRKAPAATIGDIASALKILFRAENPTEIIGIRHGEKVYETLATKEELRRSEDMGDYFRISLDDRDLNYDKYFVLGDPGELRIDDYTSHNTTRLDVADMESLLLTLPEIRAELQAAGLNVPEQAGARAT